MSELNLSTDETRVSYGIGRQLGGQLRDNPPPGVSLEAILAGLTDAFNGACLLYTSDAADDLLTV